MTDNIDIKEYDRRFYKYMFMGTMLLMLPPLVMAFVVQAVWLINWVVAIAILAATCGVTWGLVMYGTINGLKVLFKQAIAELESVYGAYDKDGLRKPAPADKPKKAGKKTRVKDDARSDTADN